LGPHVRETSSVCARTPHEYITGDGGGDEGFPAALGGLDGRWRFAAGGFSRT